MEFTRPPLLAALISRDRRGRCWVGPLINAGTGTPHAYSSRRAAKFASGVQRAIEECGSEVRPQYKSGDPQCCPRLPIHGNGFLLPLGCRLSRRPTLSADRLAGNVTITSPSVRAKRDFRAPGVSGSSLFVKAERGACSLPPCPAFSTTSMSIAKNPVRERPVSNPRHATKKRPQREGGRTEACPCGTDPDLGLWGAQTSGSSSRFPPALKVPSTMACFEIASGLIRPAPGTG
jgi:hypothetical protein